MSLKLNIHRSLSLLPYCLLGPSLKNLNANQRGHLRKKWKRKRVSVSDMNTHSHILLLFTADDWPVKYVGWFNGRRGGNSAQCTNCYVVCPCAEPSPEERLQKLHTDIKFALKVDNPVSLWFWFYTVMQHCEVVCCLENWMLVYLCVFKDIERCLQALAELEAVPVTSQILHKNAEVIATLKKVHLAFITSANSSNTATGLFMCVIMETSVHDPATLLHL